MTDILHPVTPEALAITRTTAAQYQAHHAQSLADPDAFWREQVTRLDWYQVPTIMGNWSWDPVEIKWFEDGVLNASWNCLDRWADADPNRTAIIWEADDPTTKARRIS